MQFRSCVYCSKVRWHAYIYGESWPMTTKSLRETRSSYEAWWTTNQARSADDSQRIPCRMVFNALCFERTRERYDCRAIMQIRTNPCAPASLESINPILEQSLMFSTGDFFDNLVAIQMKCNLSCTTLLSAKCNYLPRNPDNGSAHVHGDRLLTASAPDLAEKRRFCYLCGVSFLERFNGSIAQVVRD